MLHYILSITKAYTTRVGGGPFPTELDYGPGGTVGHHLSTVGRKSAAPSPAAPRRCGWLDAAALKRSIIINGISGLCITKLDVLDGSRRSALCVGYELNGKRIDILPLDADDVAACVPIYDNFPGWSESTFGVTQWDKLPLNARRTSSVFSSSSARRSTWCPPAPTANTPSCSIRSPVPAADPSANLPPGDPRMLTDDGKHLYVSWDEYHMLIEALALKVHRLGLGVRPDPVPGARRHAAGRRAVARVRQAAGDHVDQLRTAPRPAPSRAASTWPSTSRCPGRTRRPRAAGR